ncbi:unnamed protein product [Peniophora sp. CBMAI 1063]|nr:unnamed protein product [Peniophora sp. CBMAI 1063]
MRAFTAIFSIAALALGVVASPEPSPEAVNNFELVKRQCSSGSVQCCNNVQSSSSTTFNRNSYLQLLFLGFTPDQIIALQQAQASNNGVAVVCSGSGSVSCNQQNVCCNGSHFSGLNVQACNAVNA